MKPLDIDPAILNSPEVRAIAMRLLSEARANEIGQVRVDGKWMRLDADVATAFTARQLEHVKSQTYDVKKLALKARIFLPVSHEAHPGSQVISYDQWDSWGEAEIMSDYSKPSPRVDVDKRNFGKAVFGLRASYGFSVQDFRAAAMSGSMLDTARAVAGRRAIEAKLDKIVAHGDTRIGRTGFVNDANVPTFAGTAPAWSFATPAQTIFRGLNAIASQVVTQSNQVEKPDTILFPTKAFQIVTGNTFGNETPETILSAWLRINAYGVRNADQWTELDGTGEAGADRIVCYHRAPEVAEAEIPLEYMEHAPQLSGLVSVTECELRTAGTVIRYPKAMVYADGTFDIEDYEVAES